MTRRQRRAAAQASAQPADQPRMETLQQPPRGATMDGFRNAQARMGWGGNNLLSGSRYSRDNMSRDWQQLTAMYRTSWVIGLGVDVVADDMVRAGVTINSQMKPEDTELLHADMRRLLIHQHLADGVRWGRLYGGAVVILLIDGQDASTPLRLETVAPGQFKGLLVLDRWQVQPTLTDTITELGPDLGKPRFYGVLPTAPALRGQWIHHSRVIRFEGVPLPYLEAQQENGWGQSIIERMWDRLLAFDSATVGAAQLVFKAYLRTVKMKGLRSMIGAGGKALEAVTAHLDFIRAGQTNEGLTVLDAEDDFVTQTYAFSGLDNVLMQMGQQLSGALQIPLVRLFGQSPSGLNSNGESDLRTYYDGVDLQREAKLRDPMMTIVDLVHRNRFQKPLDPTATIEFNSLWQMTDEQKSTVAKAVTDTVIAASTAGLISDQTALKELRQQSRRTGVFTNITDEDIESADSEPPDPSEAMPPGMGGANPFEGGGEPGEGGGEPSAQEGEVEAASEPGGEPVAKSKSGGRVDSSVKED